MNRVILNSISPPLKHVTRIFCSPFNIQTLKRIEQSNDPTAAKLVRAILDAANSKVREEDIPLVGKIEAMRKQWLADHSPFIHDHNRQDAGAYDFKQSVRDIALASKDAKRATVLYQLANHFQPNCAIELGTNIGVSSAYQALAMRHAPNKPQFHVLDLSKARLQMAQELHTQLPLSFIQAHHGDFQDTLACTLETIPSIDYAFIDGHHQYEPSHQYTNLICQHANTGAILVFDDIRWNRGMRQFWREIKTDTRFSHIMDLFTFGVAIFAGNEHTQPPNNIGPLFIFF